MANLANASISELQGNSQFLVLGGVLYITGNTSSAGTFVIYASTDYGITATQVATYTFPSPPTPVAFDPALCTDGTNIYLIGSRQNAGARGGLRRRVISFGSSLHPTLARYFLAR